jgi:hypothetical protein
MLREVYPHNEGALRYVSAPSLSAFRYHGTMMVNWPGTVTVITPPHMHIHWDELLRAGLPLIITVGEPGAQGAGVMGTQGAGVSTPAAAVVAAATAGFVGVVHMLKDIMFTIGM